MQKRALEGKIEIVSDCIPMKEQAEISIDKHYRDNTSLQFF